MSEVKSFLQMCQYNQTFLIDTAQTYSDITSPLQELLKKNARFEWSSACEESFQKLKNTLTSENVMAHWVQGRETELIVERGPDGIEATLYQKENDTGYLEAS